MLKLLNIYKDYNATGGTVHALRGISLNFRDKEFVSILGPSGCGKTTLLNIVGGLDRYNSGDIIVDGISTKEFGEETWDAYRNATIGFVFQNYNLIQHLSVLENVEMTLKLSGFNKSEYTSMAINALKKVNMEEHIHKKPSELSGGQLQRISIARALVNNPRIILADEPTGALDSKLSEQIMELLQEVSKERLVIMVTHNANLAEMFSSRIIEMNDGEIVNDTMPFLSDDDCKEDLISINANTEESKLNKKNKKILRQERKRRNAGVFKTSYINWKTAMGLSFKNLLLKKRRTVLTSIAGSVGIIGLGLVLAFSNGINRFLESMQNSLLASIPVGIYEYSMDYSVLMDIFMTFGDRLEYEGEFPDNDIVELVDAKEGSGIMGELVEDIIDSIKENDISDDFIKYLKDMDSSWYDAMYLYYGIQMNLISKLSDGTYKDVSPSEVTTNVINIATNVLGEKGLEKKRWNQLVGTNEFISKYYDLMAGELPKDKCDLVIVVNERNELEIPALTDFGFDIESADINGDGNLSFNELLSESSGFELKLISNDNFYEKTGKKLSKFPEINEFTIKDSGYEEMYNSDEALTLKVVGVLRVKPDSPISALGTNLCYTQELVEYVLDSAKNSEVTLEQKKLLELSGYKNTDAEAYTVIKGENKVTDRYVNSSIIGLLSASLEKTSFMKSLGVDTAPVYMNIYATDLAGKNAITDYIDAWGSNYGGKVSYFDVTEMFMYNVSTITNICVYALLIVASISLFVSSIMIGIITGNSVVERTREIGILRSMGARKKDIVSVFLAETVLIGIFSGLLGIALSYAVAPLFSLIAEAFCGIPNLAVGNPLYSFGLFILSVLLAAISGLIPAFRASNKNVVDALRIE